VSPRLAMPPRPRSPRCLGCVHFTGFAPLGPPEAWDPDREEEHALTCLAFPRGIPEGVLGHQLTHHGPLPGQEGAYAYDPRDGATLSTKEAARLAGCSAATIRRYLRAGLLWGVKRGGCWLICGEEIRLLRRPGGRVGLPPGFLRPVG